MNSLLKIILLATLFLYVASTASAAVLTDLNAWDTNGARHANRGEDFNVKITSSQSWAVTNDYNYVVALSYRGRYVDLNVKVLAGTEAAASFNNGIAGGIDANVKSLTLNGPGPCNGAGDVNVIILHDGRVNDVNTFNVTVTVPSTGTINNLVGKEVLVELWGLTNTPGTTVATCIAKAADANFIVGPAIILRPVPEEGAPGVGSIDTNMTILGYGFSRDTNVSFRLSDTNRTSTGDLNICDVNETNPYHGFITTSPRIADSVYSNGDTVTRTAKGPAPYTGGYVVTDTNGDFDVNIMIPPVSSNSMAGPAGAPDNNINARNNIALDANAWIVITPSITMGAGDENVTVGVCTYRGLTLNDSDANCSAVGGTFQRVTVEKAMRSNWILNMERVEAFQVQMCDRPCSTAGAATLVLIAFNSDMNMSRGPQRNYGRDMNAQAGRAKIDTDQMPEFAMDANITIYNVKVPSGAMPVLARNGIVCPTSMCKNRDGSALSQTYVDSVVPGVRTWAYNPDAGDGNIAFRVSTFSSYEAGNLSVEVLTPNGGEKIRTPRHGMDANAWQIQFQFKDNNTQDNNLDKLYRTDANFPMKAIIYYSDYNGSKTGVIIDDGDLFDNIGIRCNGWSTFGYRGSTVSNDLNLAYDWKTCVFDLNRSDANIVGEFLIDVNVMDPWGRDTGLTSRTVIGHSDANVFFNPPLIEITDLNLNTGPNFVMNNGVGACPDSGCLADVNYDIDFNIYLPDINADLNFTLADYNVHFYLSTVQGATAAGKASDLNSGGLGRMFDFSLGPVAGRTWISHSTGVDANNLGLYVECTPPPAAYPFWDYNCIAKYDTNGVIEGRFYLVAKIFNNKTRWRVNSAGPRWSSDYNTMHRIDVNELWDINSSIYQFAINDNNAPRTSSDSTTSTTASEYSMTISCDDNASNIQNYFFEESGGSWINNGTTTTYTFSLGSATLPITKTYYGGCKDYAGNTSDINVTHTVTFQASSGGNPPADGGDDGGGGGGGGGEVTPGTETILEQTISNKPTAAEITSILTAAGASQTAIEKASAAVGKTSVSRTIKVEKTTDATGAVSYKTTIKISVENPNKSKKMVKVKVTDQIPKSVINTLKKEDITSSYAFEILKADPIIQFTIDSIGPNSKTQLSYTINKQVTKSSANSWTQPITADLQEAELCEGVSCPDRACQTGRCDTLTGRCQYTNKADGTVCDGTKECKSGSCVEKPPVGPVCGNGTCEAGEDSANCASDCPAAAPDWTMAIIAVIVIIVIAGAAIYYTKGKKKRKLGK